MIRLELMDCILEIEGRALMWRLRSDLRVVTCMDLKRISKCH